MVAVCGLAKDSEVVRISSKHVQNCQYFSQFDEIRFGCTMDAMVCCLALLL